MVGSNTQEKGRYILGHLFWISLSLFAYESTLFICFPECTLKASVIILRGLVILFAVFGVVITFAKCRNGFNTFVNILLPYEVYTAIAFRQDRKVLLGVSLGITLLFIICYLFLTFSPKIVNRAKRKKTILRRAKLGFLGSRVIAAVSMLIFFAPMLFNSMFGGTLVAKSTEAETPAPVRVCTIANNVDILRNLLEENWSTLSLSEKTDTLQTVANIEASYLGLPHELKVKVIAIGDTTLSQYRDGTHTICIDHRFLRSSDAVDALDTVCHEAYHAYQHRLCDAYDSMDAKYSSLIDFEDVRSYQEEFRNYVSGTEDFYKYYFQICEVRAREYAREGVDEYYYKIDLYSEDPDAD